MLQLSAFTVQRNQQNVFAPTDLNLSAGGAVLLLGENGAGKTSFLRGVAGLLPSSGMVQSPTRPLYIGHRNALQDELTPPEHIRFWAALENHAFALDPLDVFGLKALAKTRAGSLSQGQRRRLALCRLLLNPSPLWLLDEPHAGLDSAGLGILETLCRHHRGRGGAIIAASHGALNLPDAQSLALKVAA